MWEIELIMSSTKYFQKLADKICETVSRQVQYFNGLLEHSALNYEKDKYLSLNHNT